MPYKCLKATGFKEGDVLPIASFNNAVEKDTNITNTTYDYVYVCCNVRVVWDALTGLAGGTDVRVRWIQRLWNNTAGETTTVKLVNKTDGEDISSEITFTGDGGAEPLDTGWIDYTPTTTSSPIQILPKVKVTGGTGILYLGTVLFGIKL